MSSLLTPTNALQSLPPRSLLQEYMQLRQKWLTSHENHGYEEHTDEWLRALAVMRGPCALESVPPAIPAQGLFAALDMGPTPMEV